MWNTRHCIPEDAKDFQKFQTSGNPSVCLPFRSKLQNISICELDPWLILFTCWCLYYALASTLFILYQSPSQHPTRCPSQSTTEKSLSSTGVSSVAKPDLVFELLTTNIQSLPPDQLPFFTIGPYCNPPTKETLQVMFSNCVWKHFEDQKFLESTTQLATAAFQPGAQGNHGTCFYEWDEFCTQWKIDPGTPTLTQLGDYITLMQQEFQFGHTVSCYIST